MDLTFLWAEVDVWDPGDPNKKASVLSLNVALILLAAVLCGKKARYTRVCIMYD